jgi:hypothetical protein
MATLKAGSIDDLADSMAAAIDDAFGEEWGLANPDGPPLADEGRRDRQVLFAAVAKGVLRYLYQHQLFIDTTVVRDQPGGHSHRLAFDLVEAAGPVETP